MPASEFLYTHKGERYRFIPVSGEHFYFVGIWRPATHDWPTSYVVLTIEPNADVAPYHHRPMAVTQRKVMDSLGHQNTEEEVLRQLPPRTFWAELETSAFSEQRVLAL